ncbi:MAG: 50S ribosomal protein L18e [Candidatus Hadarchaeia archaeon]
MSKTEGPSNPVLRGLIERLRKKEKETSSPLWGDLADRLSKPNRRRAEVNISQINRHADEESIVVIPGKVLGSGRLEKTVTVAAFDFSGRARMRIQESGGEAISIDNLLTEVPEEEKIRIME